MTEQENILRWWDTVPTSTTSKYVKKIISINLMEDIQKVPRGTFQYFLNGERGLPEHHLSHLIEIIKPVGYHPLSKE